MAKRENLSIVKGSTYVKHFYWYDGPWLTVPITAITRAFPPVCTAAAHGLPANEIPARLLTIEGPDAINTDANDEGDTRLVQKIDDDTFKVVDFNASGLDAYEGNGYLAYVAPKDLTGYKARMQFRKTATAEDTLDGFTSDDGDLELTIVEGLTVFTLKAARSADYTFKSGAYDLEMYLGSGADEYVVKTFYGTFTIGNEVTR